MSITPQRVTLAGRELNRTLLWVDQYKVGRVTQQVRATLGGKPYVHASNSYLNPVTLQAVEDQGWLSHDDVTYVQTLADAPGAVYDLVVGDVQMQVVFRHEEAPAVDLTPLLGYRSRYDASDIFIGSIKFTRLK